MFFIAGFSAFSSVALAGFTTDVSCLTDDPDGTGPSPNCTLGAVQYGVCGEWIAPWSGFSTGRCMSIFCSSNSQCPSSETCSSGVCSSTCSVTADCHFGSECVSGRCLGLEPGRADYCVGSPCPKGLGDCDSNSECSTTGSLQCRSNVGAGYGYSSTDDVCTDWFNGHVNYCAIYGDCNGDECIGQTCDWGSGDCDSDSECDFGLVCGTDNGAAFGFSASTDVCKWPWE